MTGTTSRTTQLVCLVGATVFGGLLAGVDVVRLFVEMPAWRHVGAAAWAAFSRRADLIPLYAGAALTIGGMAATAFAAPQMLSLRTAGIDGAAIQRAFDGFELWGGIRSVVQTLAFLANLWALVAVASHHDEPSKGVRQ